MVIGSTDTLEDLGFQAYQKEEINNFYLAFRNTEPDVFVITDISKISAGPDVKFRLYLPDNNKIKFKRAMLSKTQFFQSVKVSFNGCYHDGDGEILVEFKLKKIYALSESENNSIIKHPKFNYKSIQIPVYVRLENSKVYLLIDSEYEFEALDADKEYSCFTQVKKPNWNNF